MADEYFGRFKEAGLLAGILVRPQHFEVSKDMKSVVQTPLPDPTAELIAKVKYAKDRWGIRLIYLDSNTNASDPNPLDADIVQKLARAFPDCLIIPEHSRLRYYAYSAPYQELRQGRTGTPAPVRSAYKSAFSVIYTADGALDSYASELKKSVKSGDVAMYRTWFVDSQNQKVKGLYDQ